MLINIIFWVTQRKWLIITFLFGIVLYLFPPPQGLTIDGYRTFVILLISILLIIFEPIPLPAVAMLILVFQVFFGIASPNEVAASFMTDAVFFIMGSLMMAVAIVSQGLDKRLALGIINITGHHTIRIVTGFVFFCAILSSFIGEHTVTAMMMPVGLTLVRHSSDDPKKIVKLTSLILFSIAYGSAIGSIGTPSGGGRNVIMLGYLSQFEMGNLSYLQWMKYTYPILLVEIPFAIILLWWTFKPEKKILDSAVRKLKVLVAKSGKITGHQIASISIVLFVFLGWVFLSPSVGLGIISLFGVVLYLSFGLVDWKEINRNTNWGAIMLFGSAISLGFQMKDTGAAIWVASELIDGLKILTDDIDFIRSFVSIFVTVGLTNFLSSAATVSVLGPIVLNMGGDSIIIALSTAMASAFAYLTVVASPTCMIIHSSGLVKSSDYLRCGWKMTIMSIIVLLMFIHLFWPLST